MRLKSPYNSHIQPGRKVVQELPLHSGEWNLINNGQQALKADLPLDIQYIVKRQYVDIKDSYDRIRIVQRAA